MHEPSPTPQINVSKIPGGGGAAGALFAVISMVIFLIGIPALRYFLLAAIVLGGAVAMVIHRIRRDTPGKPWILSGTQEPDGRAGQNRHQRPAKRLLRSWRRPWLAAGV